MKVPQTRRSMGLQNEKELQKTHLENLIAHCSLEIWRATKAGTEVSKIINYLSKFSSYVSEIKTDERY